MTWSRPDFEAVARLVGERTGLTFPPRLRPAVEEKIRRAMAGRSIRDLPRYLDLLASSDAAFEALVADLTVGETYFFREPEQMEFIRARVLPELARSGPPGSTIRVWSAGCASGEEAYTLAILLREAGLAGRASILGTDLSPERLTRARRGRYSAWSLRGLPEAVVGRYFRRQGKRYQLRREVREAVRFRAHNLAGEGFPSLASGIHGMDLVLCRNVLIYLDRDTVAGIARRLMESLGERGWLFLGASDPPLTGLVDCEVVVTGSGVAYRRVPRERPLATLVVPPDPAPPVPAPVPAPPPVPHGPPARIGDEEDEAPPPARSELESLYAAGAYARVVERAQAGLERHPADLDLWILLVRALANQGKLAAAGRACSSALEHFRTAAELMYLHGLLLASAGHDAEAIEAVRRALYLDRRLIMAHVTLGGLLLRRREPDAARIALRNAERLLVALPPGEIVPASDGETAGALLRTVRVQLKLSFSTE